MGRLSNHEDRVAHLYFEQGKSYQQIASEFGVSREAVRQFLNRHFPDRVTGRAFRKERRKAQPKNRELPVERVPTCVICGEPVLRHTGGRGPNRTCSTRCSKLWSQARFLLDPEQKARQRRSIADSIIRYPKQHSHSELRWARQVVNGERTTVRTKNRRNSKARRAYEEVLRIRREKGRS